MLYMKLASRAPWMHTLPLILLRPPQLRQLEPFHRHRAGLPPILAVAMHAGPCLLQMSTSPTHVLPGPPPTLPPTPPDITSDSIPPSPPPASTRPPTPPPPTTMLPAMPLNRQESGRGEGAALSRERGSDLKEANEVVRGDGKRQLPAPEPQPLVQQLQKHSAMLGCVCMYSRRG